MLTMNAIMLQKKIIKKRSSTKKDKKKSFRNLGKIVKTGGHGKMKQDWAAHVNLTKHIEKFDKKSSVKIEYQ